MKSAPAEIIVGAVLHERLRPCRHRFVYPVFCLKIDLERLDALDNFWLGVDRWGWMSLRRKDYGPRDGSELLTWVRQLLAQAGSPHDGQVYLQTFPRFLGYGFNPVNFWYCHDKAGALRSVLAEVNNTFGEHHLYLLQAQDGGEIERKTILKSQKVFHVSPFCQVQGHYEFSFRNGTNTSFVGIDYFDEQGLLMRTSISGKSYPYSAANLRRNFLRQPLLALGVMVRIHWQAFLLWMRKVPFYRKPPPPENSLSHDQSIPHSPKNQELQ